jgi:hypothetical protein
MLLTNGTRIYMVSTVFKIFSYFPFLGGGVDPRDHDLHTIGCALIQGTKIYRV